MGSDNSRSSSCLCVCVCVCVCLVDGGGVLSGGGERRLLIARCKSYTREQGGDETQRNR